MWTPYMEKLSETLTIVNIDKQIEPFLKSQKYKEYVNIFTVD